MGDVQVLQTDRDRQHQLRVESIGEQANGLGGAGLFINPISAVSSSGGGASPAAPDMQREPSVGPLPDLAQLKIDLGRDIDVEDLDDAGWKAASRDGKIEELGSLGEGAGGAVTRCILKDGKTVFALKVCMLPSLLLTILTGPSSRSSQPTPTQTLRNRSSENYPSTRIARPNTSAVIMAPLPMIVPAQ